MKITKNQLRRIIKEEVEAQSSAAEIETRARILKGLEIMGIEPSKLKQIPSAAKHLEALVAMVNQAIDTTIAGKGVQAQKRTSKITQSLV